MEACPERDRWNYSEIRVSLADGLVVTVDQPPLAVGVRPLCPLILASLLEREVHRGERRLYGFLQKVPPRTADSVIDQVARSLKRHRELIYRWRGAGRLKGKKIAPP